MRIALGVEYDGSSFSGWQFQEAVPSVQACVEAALSKVANHPVRVACAGRTDAGVHATGQVVHFDSESPRTLRSWVLGANANLPKEVCILWAQPVGDDFHARFSAVRRRYRYVIFTRPVRPTFLAWRVTWDYRQLDAERMAEAATSLLGQHDFTSFRAIGCQAKSPVRIIYTLELRRRGPFIEIDIEANGFLHHMVRNIAGALIAIGAGEQSPLWIGQLLEMKDRTLAGVTAPPHGLYLTGVRYPESFGLPALCDEVWLW